MDTRLHEVLNGKEGNYLLPFLWQHSGNRDILREQVRQVRRSGARALCVESRPHENFCKDEWWGDMEVILDEAASLDMRVWILDDKHFPTGYADGLIPKKYPHLGKWQLAEHHADMVGPMKDAALMMPDLNGEDMLIAAVAYPREKSNKSKESGEALINRPVDLACRIKGGWLFWDVPEGAWRVFFFFKTRRYTYQPDYIHLIDRESAHVLIEAVYETHYAHFGRYFGNTLAGFFSDEPCLGNTYFRTPVPDEGIYEMKIGTPGLALPWTDELYAKMDERLGCAAPKLAALWYPLGNIAPDVRLAYMDAVTALYRDNFTRQIGDWCRARNVEYIGHIIEDMNCHARLGYSGGHYFRSLTGQDMSGIDIVLHQIMPGFADYQTAAITFGGMSDPEFFHYVLAKLGASMAHIDPLAKGRAMCEVFGAYGWAEGAPMMKWLMDHLLVRGINYFVPHAFSPKFPDPDCPPHFGADGSDPQFAAFAKLMGYANRVSHLLCGTQHIANSAILYHAEAEWMNGKNAMLTQKPAKALYDAHIDYDILPIDALVESAQVKCGKLGINGESFDCLVIPNAPILTPLCVETLNRLQMGGLPIFYVEGAPCGVISPRIVALEELADTLKYAGMADVTIESDLPLLRVYHARRGENDYFMLFNESVTQAASTNVRFPVSASQTNYLKLNLLDNIYFSGKTTSGQIAVSLAPYESIIYVFGNDLPSLETEPAPCMRGQSLDIAYDIELCHAKDYPEFGPYRLSSKLFNITGLDGDPSFSGIMRYTASFALDGDLPEAIDLGIVGQTASVALNGQPPGMRICPPYVYDVRKIARNGENTLIIETANTLVHEVRDGFSRYVQIPPSGLIGPVKLMYR